MKTREKHTSNATDNKRRLAQHQEPPRMDETAEGEARDDTRRDETTKEKK